MMDTDIMPAMQCIAPECRSRTLSVTLLCHLHRHPNPLTEWVLAGVQPLPYLPAEQHPDDWALPLSYLVNVIPEWRDGMPEWKDDTHVLWAWSDQRLPGCVDADVLYADDGTDWYLLAEQVGFGHRYVMYSGALGGWCTQEVYHFDVQTGVSLVERHTQLNLANRSRPDSLVYALMLLTAELGRDY